MSIYKDISTLESTGRGFTINHNFIQNIKGVFLTTKDFTFTDEDLDDEDYFFDAFEAVDILPLHLVEDLDNNDTDIEVSDSDQNFTYKTNKGVLRHTLDFEWGLTFHQLVETYSGSDLYILYYDGNRNLIYTEESDGVYRGFTTNRIILNDFNAFGNGSKPVFSKLDVELFDTDEINKRGHQTKLNWMPSVIDKKFLNLKVTNIGSDFINFVAKYRNNNISTITNTDVSITDNFNGEITGLLVSYENGVYKANNFNKNITSGCLVINSSGYLGFTRYRVVSTIIIDVSLLLEGGLIELLIEGGTDVLYLEN